MGSHPPPRPSRRPAGSNATPGIPGGGSAMKQLLAEGRCRNAWNEQQVQGMVHGHDCSAINADRRECKVRGSERMRVLARHGARHLLGVTHPNRTRMARGLTWSWAADRQDPLGIHKGLSRRAKDRKVGAAKGRRCLCGAFSFAPGQASSAVRSTFVYRLQTSGCQTLGDSGTEFRASREAKRPGLTR